MIGAVDVESESWAEACVVELIAVLTGHYSQIFVFSIGIVDHDISKALDAFQ